MISYLSIVWRSQHSVIFCDHVSQVVHTFDVFFLLYGNVLGQFRAKSELYQYQYLTSALSREASTVWYLVIMCLRPSTYLMYFSCTAKFRDSSGTVSGQFRVNSGTNQIYISYNILPQHCLEKRAQCGIL